MPDILAQTSPVIGISFCLIIVRLWTVTPGVNEDSWESSQRSLTSRMPPVSNSRLSNLPVSLDRIKVRQDVCVGKAECDTMESHTMSSKAPGESDL